MLRHTRGGVAWSSVGAMMAVYEVAVQYARDREQFGRPIGGFQLVQDLLAQMLGNITASLALAVRVAQLQDRRRVPRRAGRAGQVVLHEPVARDGGWARELLGGNGILLDYGIARYFNDAEALYSFEGTREINTLIVGRAITGDQRVHLSVALAVELSRRRTR